MIFKETKLKGSYLIEIEPIEDERGFFARTFCRKEFEAQGIQFNIVQCNTSYNKKRGTLRGMHYQVKPHEEAKLVRCTRGAVYDVLIDLRPDSPTFKQWNAVELSPENRQLLFVPKGVAHGFQTLEDNTELMYQMSEYYHPEVARGVRWNDPTFGIMWPLSSPVLSDRDRSYHNICGDTVL